MDEPLIMAWTVMPFKVVAKAWTDTAFASALISTPNPVLQSALWEIPWDKNFIILQESGTQRYLVYPELPAEYAAWTQDQIMNQLIAETFGDISLQYYLPARVTARAFFDAPYQATLLSALSANPALTAMGNTPQGGQNFKVSQNGGGNMHLVLPEIPLEWNGLSYNELLQRLWAQSRQLVTGRI